MKKILLAILLLTYSINVKAYENKFFKINIPDDYKEDIIKDDIYKWIPKEDNYKEYITVTINKNNNENKYDIEKYTEENIKEYKKYLDESLNSGLEEYDIKVSVKNVKKEKINDRYTLTYETVWPTKESIGYDTYQKGYVFTTNNYVYLYSFTSDKEITEENKTFKDTFNSFKILDTEIENNSLFKEKWTKILIVGTIAGIIGYIISALKKRK